MNMFGCLGTCLVIVCGLWFQPIGKIRSIIFFHFGGGEEFQKIVETTQLVMVQVVVEPPQQICVKMNILPKPNTDELKRISTFMSPFTSIIEYDLRLFGDDFDRYQITTFGRRCFFLGRSKLLPSVPSCKSNHHFVTCCEQNEPCNCNMLGPKTVDRSQDLFKSYVL